MNISYSQMKEASLEPHPAIARTKETVDSCGIGCCAHCTLPINHKVHLAPQFPADTAVIRAFPCSACQDEGNCSVCRTL